MRIIGNDRRRASLWWLAVGESSAAPKGLLPGRRHAGFLPYPGCLLVIVARDATTPSSPTKPASPRPMDRRWTNAVGTSRCRRPPIGLPSDTLFRLSVTAARPPRAPRSQSPRAPFPPRETGCLSISGSRPHKRSQPPIHPRCRDGLGRQRMQTHNRRVTCRRCDGVRGYADNRNSGYKAAWKVGDEQRGCARARARSSTWECALWDGKVDWGVYGGRNGTVTPINHLNML